MIKKIQVLTLIICSTLAANAQEMAGFRSDNFNGVNGAFFNPANLGGSPYRIDIGILGVNVFGANKTQDFSFKTISELNGDTSSFNNIFTDGQTNTILANVALHLPSVSVTINDRLSVAFLSRSRVLFALHDFDGTLVNSIQNNSGNGGFPFTLNSGTNMRLNSNVFTEFGLSGNYNIINSGNHFLTVGGTVKYLGGVANIYAQINNLQATIDFDSVADKTYLTNTSGTIAVGTGGVDIDNLTADQFKFSSSGFGADLGLVYQYRPEHLAEETNPYLFKIGVSLLDVGSINYKVIQNTSVGYTAHIPAGQRFDLSAFDGKSISELKSVFDAYPQYFTPTAGLNNTSSYPVSLPRTLQINGDYRIAKGFYISANGQIALSNNSSKPYNPKAINSVMISPRFESKVLGIYLPISVNNLSGTNVGFGFRAGPLYAGSSSIVSGWFGKSKQADFYFGFRAGFKKKKNKTKE